MKIFHYTLPFNPYYYLNILVIAYLADIPFAENRIDIVYIDLLMSNPIAFTLG